jgi:arylsulfatase A-like enzyme
MEALSSTPEGREAWIVVVSDHNLHKNRFLRGPKNHVPFIVHRPGQTGRRDIAAPADLTDLRHVLPELPIFGEDAGAAGPEP